MFQTIRHAIRKFKQRQRLTRQHDKIISDASALAGATIKLDGNVTAVVGRLNSMYKRVYRIRAALNKSA